MARCTNNYVFVACPNPVQVGYLMRKYMVEPEFVKEVDERWTDIGLIRKTLESLGLTILEQGVLDVPPWPDTVMPASELLGRLGIRSKKMQGKFEGRGLAVVHHGVLPGAAAGPVSTRHEVRLARPVAAALAGEAGVGASPLGAWPANRSANPTRRNSDYPERSQAASPPVAGQTVAASARNHD